MRLFLPLTYRILTMASDENSVKKMFPEGSISLLNTELALKPGEAVIGIYFKESKKRELLANPSMPVLPDVITVLIEKFASTGELTYENVITEGCGGRAVVRFGAQRDAILDVLGFIQKERSKERSKEKIFFKVPVEVTGELMDRIFDELNTNKSPDGKVLFDTVVKILADAGHKPIEANVAAPASWSCSIS
ncbi:hypothetical protein [Legionella sp. CNM-4043-24]|uniref:hypothetical protein n=1 Tax=Legionella sp. CNM-4043-24 TaxID=3421646 RepID=UPI00403A89DA